MEICTKGTPTDGSGRYNSDGLLLDAPPCVCRRFAEPLFLAEGFKRHHWASLPAVRCQRFSDYQSCCDHHSYFSFECCFTAFSRKFL